MARSWTFGQKIGAGFAVIVGLAMLIAAVSVYALRTVVASKDRVVAVNAQNLIDAEKLHSAIEKKLVAGRAFLLSRDDLSLERMRAARADFATGIAHLKSQVYAEESRRLVDQIEHAEADHQAVLDRA